MRHHPAFALALLSTVLLASCGGGASPSSSGPAPGGSAGAGGLEARTFLSTAVDGRVLVAGSRIRLSFRNGQVSASGGCNSMGGAYHLDGNRLVTDQLITTDMACAQALMTQDQWVAALLNGATLSLDGNSLTMSGNGVRVTLLDRVVADPDRPLIGTRWVIDGLLAGNTASSIPFGATAALTFSDGRVDVETGCNTGGGTALVAGGSITFGTLTLTKRACAAEIAGLEQAIVQTLTGTVAYTIDADIMALTARGAGLSLHAAK
jgi:heat shock protein HslJ